MSKNISQMFRALQYRALQSLVGVSNNQSIIAECASSKATNIGQELAPLGLKFIYHS